MYISLVYILIISYKYLSKLIKDIAMKNSEMKEQTNINNSGRKVSRELEFDRDEIESGLVDLSAEGYFTKGNQYYAQERYQEALKCYDLALELRPTTLLPIITRGSPCLTWEITKALSSVMI